MSLSPPRRAAPPVALLLLSLSLAGCDDVATLGPARQSVVAESFAGGIPMGTFGLPNTEFGSRYNGAHRNILPADLLAALAAIQSRGGKVVLVLAGGPNQYKDAEGHFSFSLWQSRVNRFKTLDFSAYIQDGTVMGHYLMDEPNDANNWNGVPVPGETVEAMAQYSKQLWPDLPTVVRSEAAYLARAGITYRYLDAAWAQYVARKGAVADFLQHNVADAQRLGLELVVGLNLLDGGPGGAAMTALQVRDWGGVLLSSSYPCAFLSWKHDATYLASAEMGGAMDELRSQAQGRPTKSCRSSGGSPPPPPPDPDPAPLATSTTIEADTPDPSTPGQEITIRVAVGANGSTPTGAVAVTASGGDERCTATLSNGAGVCTLTFADAGNRTLTAAYAGTAEFGASSDTESHAVEGTGTPAEVAIAWAEPQDITYGTPLGGAQLDATASSGGTAVAGTITYEPGAGTVLGAGEDQELTATFTPSDPRTYGSATATVRLDVQRATPTLAWTVPASTPIGPLSSALLNATAAGVGGADVAGTFTYSPAAGQVLDASPSQALSVSFQPSSSNYTGATRTVSLAVLYPWSGFLAPVDNPQVLNRAKAGTAIPVRFSLGGDRPAPVLASGSPEITTVNCPKWPGDDIEETVSASASSLRYESATGQYVYTWKTETKWVGGCRRFRLVMKDGTWREAIFRFAR